MGPTQLSDFLQQARLAAGLRPGELACRAGWKNAELGGNLIARLERDGDSVASDATISDLARALGISDETVAKLESEERRNARAAWQAWTREPIQTSLMVRMMPTMWHRVPIPPELTERTDVLAWARDHPNYRTLLRCIMWDRTHCTYLREDGTTYEAHAGFGDPDASPGASIK